MSILEYLRERRQSVAKSGRIMMLHGTSDKFLKSILANGLIPNPKRRTWEDDPNPSFNVPSRVSYGGVYFSKNVFTAIQSARNTKNKLGGKDPLIVVSQIQPKTALPDEDSFQSYIKFALDYAISEGGNYSQNDFMYVYAYYCHLVNNDEFEDHVKYFIKQMINFACHTSEMKQACQTSNKIVDKMNRLYIASIKRIVSHIDLDLQKRYLNEFFDREGKEFSEEYIITDKASAEREYMQATDDITRSFKNFVMNKLDTFDLTLRVMEPVGFSGPNKIIAIFELENYFNNDHDDVRIVVHYGQIPDDIIQDFKEIMGVEFEIIEKDRENVST